jgi:5-formyltetrahydrofolate cyclo-ligase
VSSQPTVCFLFPRIASADPPRLVWGSQPLEPGAWGLMEPLITPHDLPPVQLLLAPGLAFSPDGHRLGYGKGFYDAVLAQLPPEVLTLGVGFGFQRCEALPAGPRDIPLQGFACEEGIRWRVTPA